MEARQLLEQAIPWQFREILEFCLTYRARRAFRRSLRGGDWDQIDSVLGLAGALDAKHIHGGAIKLLHLRKRFGDAPAKFQVLYLVSSALPRFWDETALWARGHGAAIVWNQNGVAYPAWAGSEYPRWNRPMRNGMRLAGHVIYQTDFCRRTSDRFVGPAPVTSTVLMNPVDTAVFSPAERRKCGDRLRMLAIGTHASAARVRVTLSTLGELIRRGVDAVLTIAGRCDWRTAGSDLPSWIGEMSLGNRVTLLGAFTQIEAIEHYRSHDLLLHCKAMDPCPTVVAEALACGVPVIGQANGGLPEMVALGCGRLVDAPNDYDRDHTPSHELFADAVMEVLPRLGEYSRLARENAETRFGIDNWLKEHERIFEDLRAC